jgi:hypothetical protein
MTLTLELSAAEEAKLLAKAEEGVPVEKILRDLALGIIGEPVRSGSSHPVSAEQMRRAFEELAELLPKNLPAMPMDALRRENLQADERAN